MTHDERAALRRDVVHRASALIQRGGQAFAACRYAEAEVLARAAITCLGERAPNTAIGCAAARSLGTVLRVRARYDEAERHLRAAVQWARASGPVELANSHNALGMLFKYTGRYTDALRLYRRALETLEAQFGARDVRLAPILHNLGGVEHARGRFAQGEAHARRGLAVRRRALGRNDVLVAKDEVALGALLGGQGKLGEARPLCHTTLGC